MAGAEARAGGARDRGARDGGDPGRNGGVNGGALKIDDWKIDGSRDDGSRDDDGEPTREVVDVVAAVIRRDGRLLLARRPLAKRHGGRWELPGGKLRSGETLARAAARELAEELGVRVVRVGEPRASIRDPGSPYVVRFCPVEIEGEPRPREHDELRWATVAEARRLDLAPSDERFLQLLGVAPEREPDDGAGERL